MRKTNEAQLRASKRYYWRHRKERLEYAKYRYETDEKFREERRRYGREYYHLQRELQKMLEIKVHKNETKVYVNPEADML